MKTRCISHLLLCWLTLGSAAHAQQYFRLLEQGGTPYEQKLARFANGDVVLGGSPFTGATADQNGGLNLTRLDACGQVQWAMNYQWKRNYMTLKDIAVNEAEDIFVYGSAYEGADEFIFLLKLNRKGVPQIFRVFHGGAVDNFTYNIELQRDKVLAYGLLLDWNTPKRGFLVLFDENLNLQKGRVFEPFESIGEAIGTKDQGFLGRSGLFLVKWDAQLNRQWATELLAAAGSGLYPVAGPLPVADGYIFEALYKQNAFFYKVNDRGQLVWQSALFPSTSQAADLTLLPDGQVLATYNCPGEGENYPCQLGLTPAGIIAQQRKLTVEVPLRTAAIYHFVGNNQVANVVGSRILQGAEPEVPDGFLLQYHIDSLSGKCFQWESFTDTLINDAILQFSPLDLTFFNLNFRPIAASVTATRTNFFNFLESCDVLLNDTLRFDTVLQCGETWTVALPRPDFTWEDESKDNPRTLEKPGVYRAANKDCLQPLTYEYKVEKIPCDCKVYLPTAFSPNQDGQNDRLELFSNCTIQQLQMSIYNRWGGKIFDNQDPAAGWDGTARQKNAEPGIYLAVLHYQLVNETNQMQEGSLVQAITLTR